MSRYQLGIITVFLIALLQSRHPAFGQMMVCMPERQKFCHDVQLGGGRVADCLRAHEKELSEACHEALYGPPKDAAETGHVTNAAANDTKAECRGDAMKYCHDAIGDKTGMKTCMQEHAAQLSDACKTALIAHGK